MKKIVSIIMALAMVLTLSACGNIKDVTKMGTVGNEQADKGVFNYYLMAAKSQAIQMTAQNETPLTAESAEEDWNKTMIEEKSAKDYALDYAKDAMKSALVLKAKAVADGLTLTDEDKENIKTQRDQFIESYGGRYNYEQYITEMGFTLEDVEKILELDAYGQKVVEKYFGDGEKDGEIKVSDEDIKKTFESEYVMAKHILISNQPETEAPAEEVAPEEEASEEAPVESATPEESAAPAESAAPEASEAPAESAAPSEEDAAKAAEEADKAAKAKAEDIIKQLEGGADFDALMKENTDDKNSETGEINGLNGYVFTKGEMVKEFEDEAFKLEVNAMSKAPVATDYGYHILWKLPLPTEGEEYDTAIASVKNKALSDKMEEMIDKWAEELGFKANDKAISKIKFA